MVITALISLSQAARTQTFFFLKFTILSNGGGKSFIFPCYLFSIQYVWKEGLRRP